MEDVEPWTPEYDVGLSDLVMNQGLSKGGESW